MQRFFNKQTGVIEETLSGIVDRVTFYNLENGWAILLVFPFNAPRQQEIVIFQQSRWP